MTDQDPATIIRQLLRGLDRAVLSTHLARVPGHPYGSLVLYATAPDASPLLLLSDLADHTRNLKADDRAALTLDGTAGLVEPLTGARVTLVGRVARDDAAVDRRRYLARHPAAEAYAGFGDFNLYRMTIESAHLVAGFGRIHWLEAAAFTPPAPPALTEAEPDIVAHMNADHADAVELIAGLAERVGGVAGDDPRWVITGVDSEGADLRRGGAVARVGFDKRVETAEAARVELVRLVKRARQSPGSA